MLHPRIVSGDAAIEKACLALAAGRLVGMPTETVYGLAADAADPEAVARLYAAKGRPSFNPLIAHVAFIDMAGTEGQLDERTQALAARFWPGPLTMVVPVHPEGTSAELARAGLETLGLRVPAHPVAQALLQAYGRPVVAPSANPSGRLSPTSASDVAEAFGQEVDLVVEGGRCEAGIESTIISLLPDEPPRLLRPGAIAAEDIEAVVGKLEDAEPGEISAPGQLSSHYAPNAEIRLNATEFSADEVPLGFGPEAPEGALNLSSAGDTVEAAANLYQYLRELDATGARRIAVMPIPETGLGLAINDRLSRAAAPRPDGEPTLH